jgi:hypothetical protein
MSGPFRDVLPARPWERLTHRLWDALLVAEEEAEYLRHDRLGAEHLLIGLAAEGGGVGAQVLAELGATAPRLRAALGRSTGAEPLGLELDDAARRATELMADECATLGHQYIGQEHLLLALVRDEAGGPAAELLAAVGVDPDRVRALVMETLARPSDGQPAHAAAPSASHPSTSASVPVRLVFVEGIMGAGKSTTGRWLARELGRHGVEARFLWEGRTIEEPVHPLRVSNTLEHSRAPWRDRSPEEYVALSLAMWRSFVEGSAAAQTATVCDGLLFHGNLTDLMLMDAEPTLVARYAERVVEAAGPLAPAVVYLRQTDVPAALRRVSDQRGPEWVTYQVDWKLASPYAERRGLRGYDGLVRLYEEYVALCLELLEQLRLPKLVVERDGDWSRARSAVRAFLSLC